MKNKDNKKMAFTTMGGSSIITIFAVLCLIVFALLSLSTAKANHFLEQKNVTATSNYYKADTEAEEILAKIRSGEKVGCVTEKKDVYSYEVQIDEDQVLAVKVKIDGANYKILKWKKEYRGDWQADDTIKVWGGEELDIVG